VWLSLSEEDRAAIERGTRAYYEKWSAGRFPPYDEEVKDEEGSEILADFYRDLIGRPIALRREWKADPKGLCRVIREELDHAYAKHGRDPWGRHEFYAILLEEVEELWDAIKSDAPQEEVLAELRQVAAMCFRYVETGDRYRGAHPDVPGRRAPGGDGKGGG